MFGNQTSVDSIRRRLIRAHSAEAVSAGSSSDHVEHREDPDQRLERALEFLDRSISAIGAPPPAPPTMRGRIGRYLVTALRRALFWYTPSIRTALSATASATRSSHDGLREALEAQCSTLHQAVQEVNEKIDRLDRCADEALARSAVQFGNLETSPAARMDPTSAPRQGSRHEPAAPESTAVRRLENDYVDTNARVSAEVRRLEGLIEFQAAELREVRRRISELIDSIHRVAVGLASGPEPRRCTNGSPENTEVDMDALYLAFANRFRGSEDSVRLKLLPYLTYLSSPAAPSSGDVLDIGCGRGEWITLLRENAIPAIGVDSNKAMVSNCTAASLHVELADGITYLAGVASESFRAVSAFHVIEHIGLSSLQRLLRDAHRSLKPGGLLLLETPNPENLIVGASGFYLDPTHRRPLPPVFLEFLVQEAGFENVELVFMNPSEAGERFGDAGESDFQRSVAHYLFGPQDYSVIAQKPDNRP